MTKIHKCHEEFLVNNDYLINVAGSLAVVQDDLPVCEPDEVGDQHSNHRLDVVALCGHEIGQEVSVGGYDWRVLVGPSNFEKCYHEIFHLRFESAVEMKIVITNEL
jgi:hypothetical protein